MSLELLKGGFNLSPADQQLVNQQKALTAQINHKLIQVGAIFLKPASRHPIDGGWFNVTNGTTDLQAWIDDPKQQPLNVGFNLQFGWMDVDADGPDAAYQRSIGAALQYLGADTRFAFGRASKGTPSHWLIKLPEDEAANFEELKKFSPSKIVLKGDRYHVETRCFPTNSDAKNVEKVARQVVVPGSVYSNKSDADKPDVSIWYGKKGDAASNIRDIADTTPRITSFITVVRAIAFGTICYLLRERWVEGSRHETANKLTGWLARVIKDSAAINDNENLSRDVNCPLDSDSVAEKLIRFICEFYGDEEAPMRVRTYHDAADKLSRNPDAKIPGWTSLATMLGAEAVQALRTIITPGADVSNLTKMAERYIYDETDNKYIDRERHVNHSLFIHEGADLERRHKGDVIFVGNKPREVFRVFEGSNLRKRVDTRDMFPDCDPGQIVRIDEMGKLVGDEDDRGVTVFNTWQGWPIQPIERIDEAVMERCVEMMDRMFKLLTQDNAEQIKWIKSWIAWTRQNPGTKQQIALVIIGGQGVGKSFWGNTFMKALLGSKLWGTASPKVVDDKFNVGPFKNKMFVFIDEAKFTGDTSTEEIKKLIRNTDISGMEKFEEARDYRVFARLAFASNVFKTGISQRNMQDRALFYTRAVDARHMKMTDEEFNRWAETLKPFYDDFAKALNDPISVRHFVRYFCDYQCERHEIESIKHSSGADADIVLSNASWSRRITKAILESGWIAAEDLSFDMPFELVHLSARVQQECRIYGFTNIGTESVIAEFHSTGMFGSDVGYATGNKRMLRFRQRWGDVLQAYSGATGLALEPYRELIKSDHGINEASSTKIEKRLGGRATLSDRF